MTKEAARNLVRSFDRPQIGWFTWQEFSRIFAARRAMALVNSWAGRE